MQTCLASALGYLHDSREIGLKHFFVIVTSLLLFTACGAGNDTELEPAQLFELETAGEDFPVSGPPNFDASYHYLSVPENWEKPSSQNIRLPVVIIRAAQGGSDLPPVMMVVGGPGIGDMSAAAYASAYPWTAERDFIIFGQRGTEHASPALMCPEYNDAIAKELSERVSALKNCRDRLTSDGMDLDQYHSLAISRDIDALRQAIGVQSISLYGLSYGTRVALTYAREFPEQVSSMVLDSVLPHTAKYDDTGLQNYFEALQRISDICDSEPACAAAYPNSAQRYLSALEDAAEAPWDNSAFNPERPDVTIDDLASIVGIDSEYEVSIAPALMSAIANRDLETINSFLSASAGSNLAWGMRLSVWCSEAFAHSEFVRSGHQAGGTFSDIQSSVFTAEECEAWNVSTRPDAEIAPTQSDIPVLLISGELDAATPPWMADEASTTLPNSRFIVLKGGLHTETTRWDGDGCAMSIAGQFFRDHETVLKQPEFECLNNRRNAEFYVE